ncbi:hypothetical protein N474_11310 [Pseudoalteromonas luteoviolacea CPMOR-2]|uniref:Uncharacterized protein n=1 Tax=Pseudoalteromonas luteoviolacea DSM 6061 TaxID=1365250 RepID=A0A166V8L8_9GAMM|nr:hypothetical protein N475_22065 [Pseudoalteromonas luteoviolacea DSM 6061]KZN56733.1 hypothetical protein N474_11310 [Pseudoalteromonas luteoviolacea CPMOR-2]
MKFDTGVIMSLFYHFVVKTYLAALYRAAFFQPACKVSAEYLLG